LYFLYRQDEQIRKPNSDRLLAVENPILHRKKFVIAGQSMKPLWFAVQQVWDRITGGVTAPPIVRSVTDNALSYLGRVALTELFQQIRRIEAENATGILIEAGCALGGSAIVIASAKSTERPLYVYDVFGMIPPPSDKDGDDVHARYGAILAGAAQGLGGQPYYGYQESLYDDVIGNFARYNLPINKNNVTLVKGLFQETLSITQDVALAHVDGDWYDSVKVCLERIEPWLVSGGVMIVDDYYHWSGCRMAVDEYFQDKKERYTFRHRSRLHIVRR
jgi:asparagine synthase (glutamine-hydrolysing)